MDLPNYERIQHATVRAKVDPKFWRLQQGLDEAWYGDMDENGRSNRATGAKAGMRGRGWHGVEIRFVDQFNRLSALIESHRMSALVDQNANDGVPYPDLEEQGKGEALARIEMERAAGLNIDAILASNR